jgi:hypothetical protein
MRMALPFLRTILAAKNNQAKPSEFEEKLFPS